MSCIFFPFAGLFANLDLLNFFLFSSFCLLFWDADILFMLFFLSSGFLCDPRTACKSSDREGICQIFSQVCRYVSSMRLGKISQEIKK